MISLGSPNPLAVFGLRETKHCPPHFVKLYFDTECELNKAVLWVLTECAGRYFVSTHCTDSLPALHKKFYIGLEDHSEATMYSLSNIANKTDGLLY